MTESMGAEPALSLHRATGKPPDNAIGMGQFDAACGMLTALGNEANSLRDIGIPSAQGDAIIA